MRTSFAAKAAAAMAAQGAAVAAGLYLYRREPSSEAPAAAAHRPPDGPVDPMSPQAVVRAAHSIVEAANSTGFVCTQWRGNAPECRIMDTHWLGRGDSLDVALVSRTFTRKAESLRANAKCTVCYHDPRDSGMNGYLALTGSVREIPASSDERNRLWKDTWSFFHPSPQHQEVVVWHFVPVKAEIVSHEHLLRDDWAAITMHRSGSDWQLQTPGRRRQEPGHA